MIVNIDVLKAQENVQEMSGDECKRDGRSDQDEHAGVNPNGHSTLQKRNAQQVDGDDDHARDDAHAENVARKHVRRVSLLAQEIDGRHADTKLQKLRSQVGNEHGDREHPQTLGSESTRCNDADRGVQHHHQHIRCQGGRRTPQKPERFHRRHCPSCAR